jgi:hypothetical protein
VILVLLATQDEVSERLLHRARLSCEQAAEVAQWALEEEARVTT